MRQTQGWHKRNTSSWLKKHWVDSLLALPHYATLCHIIPQYLHTKTRLSSQCHSVVRLGAHTPNWVPGRWLQWTDKTWGWPGRSPSTALQTGKSLTFKDAMVKLGWIWMNRRWSCHLQNHQIDNSCLLAITQFRSVMVAWPSPNVAILSEYCICLCFDGEKYESRKMG